MGKYAKWTLLMALVKHPKQTLLDLYFGETCEENLIYGSVLSVKHAKWKSSILLVKHAEKPY